MDTSASGKIGVCVVGTGRIGAVHFNNIVANLRFKLLYVIDVDTKRAAEFANKAGGDCLSSGSLDVALKDDRVKAIVVCTPTADHREIILASIRAGKAIMCEKPISLKVEEIDECYNEAAKHKIPLLCGYQRRSDPSFVQLQETCRKGGVGTLQIVKTMSRDNPVPTLAYLKISGGIFHDCGSHDIDLCRWILNEDPDEVYCVASAFRKEIAEINDFDTVLITLKYPSGALGSIDLSREAVYGYDQRIEVHGSGGMVQAMNRQPTSMVLSTKQGVSIDPNCYSFPQRYEHAYAKELDHFADVVEGKAVPKLTHDDARKVAIIADAAEESCRTGKPVSMKGRY
jgi:myo-inositol 2-dehydrogenase/D-chiro-inositol 1-dehydrogenase